MADDISTAAVGASQVPKEDVEIVEDKDTPSRLGHNTEASNLNVAHMSPDHRVRVEKSLKRKLDARCGLFVLSTYCRPFSFNPSRTIAVFRILCLDFQTKQLEVLF